MTPQTGSTSAGILSSDMADQREQLIAMSGVLQPELVVEERGLSCREALPTERELAACVDQFSEAGHPVTHPNSARPWKRIRNGR